MYAMMAVAGVQLIGGYFAAQNIKDTAEINQEIADMNAEFAELDAYEAVIDGESDIAKYQSVIDQTLSEQKTIMSAQDIDTSYGTASTVEAETRFMAEVNKAEIRRQAQETALGYKREARDFRLGGQLSRSQADSKASSVQFQSLLGATQTGLTGYSNYKRSQSNGSTSTTTKTNSEF